MSFSNSTFCTEDTTERDGALNGFEVCGDDKVFHPAKAKVEGNTVVVTSERVGKPVAVRYGWKNYPVVNLYNTTTGEKKGPRAAGDPVPHRRLPAGDGDAEKVMATANGPA